MSQLAIDCSIDKLGRILIPPQMREYAQLDRDVVLVGALRYVEIWDKGSLDGLEASTSEDYIVNTLERLGL
jgi:MraZ protein